MTDTSDPVVVVGAGMAGLRSAVQLQEYTENVLVLEASERVGGRVQTDHKDGFLLDRGFQIFLTAYPESQSVFDYDALQLYPFMDGALVRKNGEFEELVDPRSHPQYLLSTMMSEVGTWEDRWRTWKLQRALQNTPVEQLLSKSDRTTREFLENQGFSQSYIEEFFRPFFSGVFLETDLRTESSFFQFLYRMFGEGKGTLPKEGMQSVPDQLLSRLTDGTIEYNTRVTDVTAGAVTVEGGRSIDAQAVIVAVDGWSVSSLGMHGEHVANGTSCFYYAMDTSPIDQPILVLNGEAEGVITNLCVPSLVCPNYSPPGRHLLSVSTVHEHGEQVSPEEVTAELKNWFGDQVADWERLATYDVPNALPRRYPQDDRKPSGTCRVEPGLYQAGDYLETPSLNGALASGRVAAEQVVNDLGLE